MPEARKVRPKSPAIVVTPAAHRARSVAGQTSRSVVGLRNTVGSEQTSVVGSRNAVGSEQTSVAGSTSALGQKRLDGPAAVQDGR
jgi:hypothetical protein